LHDRIEKVNLELQNEKVKNNRLEAKINVIEDYLQNTYTLPKTPAPYTTTQNTLTQSTLIPSLIEIN